MNDYIPQENNEAFLRSNAKTVRLEKQNKQKICGRYGKIILQKYKRWRYRGISNSSMCGKKEKKNG